MLASARRPAAKAQRFSIRTGKKEQRRNAAGGASAAASVCRPNVLIVLMAGALTQRRLLQ
jgi:hypothetical protein